jgi:hypothetical protein
VAVPSLRISALHVFLLANVAIALPLFDVLGAQAHFFVAQGSEPEDVIALVLAVSFALPALLVALEYALELVSRGARAPFHLGLVAVFCALYALRTLNAAFGPTAWLALPVATLLAIGATAVYARYREIQLFVTLLSPATLLIPALFVFYSPVSHIALDVSLPLPEALDPDAGRKPPIVLVVFDELPTLSLLDAEGMMDERRFPSFARLAGRAHWFRYASGAADTTPGAVTSIVSGMHDRKGTLAGYRSQPRTLFSLLRDSYSLNAWETVTRLVPPELHKKRALRDDGHFGQRMRRLIGDIRIVYLHQIVPADLRRGLPDVTSAWAQWAEARAPGERHREKDKWQRELFHADRGSDVERFIDSIGPSRHPTLHFMHTMLPHTPWLHLPSGKLHDEVREAAEQRQRNAEDVRLAWKVGPESRMILQQQKHLLQTAYADALLGRLLDRLEQQGILDETLVVVTADHGRSFVVGETTRAPTSRNYSETMLVPLLVKVPGQRDGVVSDVNAQNVDVLPTIAGVLGAEVPWQLDGTSLFSDAPRPREKRFFSYSTEKVSYPMDAVVAHARTLLERNIRRFDLAANDHDLYRFGPHRYAIGRDVQTVAGIGSPVPVDYERGSSAIPVDPTSAVLPTHLVGWIEPPDVPTGARFVAVSVNGIVAAVPRLLTVGERARFEAFIPENLMRPGENRVEVHPVEAAGTQTERGFGRRTGLNSTVRLRVSTARDPLSHDRGSL